jgi:hypothetical protein
MVMFPEMVEDFQVWRYGKADPTAWEDPKFNLVAVVRGHTEPVSPNAEFLNKQDFQSVTEYCFLDITYKDIVQPDDYLVDSEGTQYINKGVPETWKHILPYVMLKLERSQQPIEFPEVEP